MRALSNDVHYIELSFTHTSHRMNDIADLAQPPQVGEALAQLRARRQLTLDELSRRAGVSKSMLSQIERNQANPTVAVVWRLATARADAFGRSASRRMPMICSSVNRVFICKFSKVQTTMRTHSQIGYRNQPQVMPSNVRVERAARGRSSAPQA